MRIALLSLFLSVVLFSKEIVEVFAAHISAKSDYLEATGDVLILYDGALLKSDSATYDKNASLLTLKGNVEMLSEDEKRVSSTKLVIDTSSKEIEFKKLFLTAEENIWIEASKATKKENKYTIYESKLSSCNHVNPDWTIEFAEAKYRKKRNIISMKEATLKFYDTPVFYFPFIAFSTISERTTGLLFPKFQLSDSEGLVYAQPYFYVPSENVDIEITPQIRTHRGFGTHISTRFVDSNHSKGSFTAGYFKNMDNYDEINNIHKEHYGFEFLYSSTEPIPDSWLWDGAKSGLYANGTYLNDLEYLNLQKNTASALINSNLIESRLNAFAYDEKNYLGFYSKYYIDTTKESNKETLQEFPTLHYHSFMNKIFTDNLFYTFDAKVHHYRREEGSRAYQTEFNLPITYYDSFFNDYLDLTLSENLYLSDVYFSNLGYESDNYRYYRNFHTLELSSDLVKLYGEGTHTLHPSFIYTKPSFEKEDPTKYSDLNENQKELFVTQTQREQLSLGLSQYYYNGDLEMDLFHRVAFVQYPKAYEDRGDINNEFSYVGEDLTLYSNLFYSLDLEKIRSLTSSLGYNQNNYDIMLTHFYNNDSLTNLKKTSFINTALIHNYNEHNQWFANYDYDLEQGFNHQWHVGWTHRQKCWGAKISMGQENIPNLEDSFRNNILYFELNLNPFGGIAQSIEQEFSSQGR